MTPEQAKQFAAMARCRFLPGSWDKRFVMGLAASPEVELTPKQAEALDRLWHRYRGQLRAIVKPEDGLEVPCESLEERSGP